MAGIFFLLDGSVVAIVYKISNGVLYIYFTFLPELNLFTIWQERYLSPDAYYFGIYLMMMMMMMMIKIR